MIVPVVPKKKIVHNTRFPVSTFWIILGVLLLTTGLHVGLILLMETLKTQNEHLDGLIATHVILLYWLLVTAFITVYLNRQFKKSYIEPTQKISQAMERIAQGDFSVRLEPTHSEKKQDYLDSMMLDLNRMAA